MDGLGAAEGRGRNLPDLAATSATDGLRAADFCAIEDGHGLVLRGAAWAPDVSIAELERPLERIRHEIQEMRDVLKTAANLDNPVLRSDAIGADDGTTITEVASHRPRPS